MNNNHLSIASLLLLLNILLASTSAPQKVYIVYLGEHGGEKAVQEIEDDHHSYLQYAKSSKEEAKASIIYSYKHVINGFSAMLTPREAAVISEMDGVISVFESQERKLHTTRSWDFIRLLESISSSGTWANREALLRRASLFESQERKLHTTRSRDFMDLLESNSSSGTQANREALPRRANQGQDLIVGVLDTGVWPESQSFNAQGMDPVPTSWRGTCETGPAFDSSHCNRKLIGARYFVRNFEIQYGPIQPTVDYRSPRDSEGHGSHTASTVGGRAVPNAAALGGFASGTATGGVPLVRLAIYKVCWSRISRQSSRKKNGCFDADILAAFDAAIDDGVHVISISIGGKGSKQYVNDGIAIGALHAEKRNIVVSASAGNSGPTGYTVNNVAPWLITVGASSIDRVFPSPVALGNGIVIEGQSVTPLQRSTYPLVFASEAEVPGTTNSTTTGLCYGGTLSPRLVRGKAVFCWAGDVYQALEVQRAGGAAVVLGNTQYGIGVNTRPYLIPGTVILRNDAQRTYNYAANDQAPTVTLSPSTTVTGATPAPFVAEFSSRGPNELEPNILKPDVVAPGVNILAAWIDRSPLSISEDTRAVSYNIISGTSMACPHVSAVAVYLKAIHPRWSSAAIKSAIITTATQTNNLRNPITDARGNPATPLEIGSGHIRPSKAADPGLVYNASYPDYLLFLCKSSGNLLDPSFRCPTVAPEAYTLNYPSLSITSLRGTIMVSRAVTNVGAARSSYSVAINQPPGFSVRISPTTLNFNAIGQTLNFSITVQALSSAQRNVSAYGSYTWSDGVHQVRSPIVVSAA